MDVKRVRRHYETSKGRKYSQFVFSRSELREEQRASMIREESQSHCDLHLGGRSRGTALHCGRSTALLRC